MLFLECFQIFKAFQKRGQPERKTRQHLANFVVFLLALGGEHSQKKNQTHSAPWLEVACFEVRFLGD